ncbi:MAG TPA: response regulator transcription factor [Chloroflexia bacterium]|nr:response regulator transcription factor [Chloroflexia bacterium]
MRILAVDDDTGILDLLRRGLTYEGYTVDAMEDGEAALAQARDQPPDLVVLDWMLPGLDGLEVCRRLRAGGDVPILLLTARGGVPDKVAGLDSGADDYLVKPFEFDELLARVRALLRRRQAAANSAAVLRVGRLAITPAAREVLYDGHVVEVSGKEFDVLDLLAHHPRQVVTREQFYDRIWGYNFGGESNILEVYIRYLRQKLEKFGAAGMIGTVRGLGYVLRDPDEEKS